jgi:hypothetical protein
MNKNYIPKCFLCVNKDDEKRMVHSTKMKGKCFVKKEHNDTHTEVIKEIDLRMIHEEGKRQFANMSEQFKEHYYTKHLSVPKMQNMMNYLIGLRNGKITKQQLEHCEYWDVFPCSNQMKFTSVFYDPTTDEIYRIDQPLIKCQECDVTWKAKNLIPCVDSIKILCKTCKLCRKIFKIRGYLNVNNEKVTYQSKPERAFLDWCEDHDIVARNGPQLPYTFGDKQKTYHVDFEIPEIGYMIEVKDDHCWHKEQVKSGKWAAKMQGVHKAIDDGLYKKYLLLTPQTKSNCLKEILSRISKI